ncbi:hypothetical protein H4R33_005156 [Dimargaris cristalligena]|nr:hypothetical protein H4R33_005156 [Dimargaris cristalligena]
MDVEKNEEFGFFNVQQLLVTLLLLYPFFSTSEIISIPPVLGRAGLYKYDAVATPVPTRMVA